MTKNQNGKSLPISSTQIDKWVAGAAATHLEAIEYARKSAVKAKETGDFLNQIKTALGHGMWSVWFDENQKQLGFSRRTATNYMRVASQWRWIKPRVEEGDVWTVNQALMALRAKDTKEANTLLTYEAELGSLRARLIKVLKDEVQCWPSSTVLLLGALLHRPHEENLDHFRLYLRRLRSELDDIAEPIHAIWYQWFRLSHMENISHDKCLEKIKGEVVNTFKDMDGLSEYQKFTIAQVLEDPEFLEGADQDASFSDLLPKRLRVEGETTKQTTTPLTCTPSG